MSDAHYLSLSLPDIVERAFGIPFTVSDVSRFSPSEMQLHQLALDVQHFYDSFAWKPKTVSELRPYIAPFYVAAERFGGGFVTGAASGGTGYVYDSSVQGELSRNVKKYLLYCHSLCIHDRLPYLLDYFHSNPSSKHARARIPAVQGLLLEYARLGELLRSGILIPVSQEVFGGIISSTAPVHTAALQKLLPDRSEPELELLEDIIHRLQIHAERVDDNIDLFFPTQEYVDVLRQLLVIARRKTTSLQLDEPSRLVMLEHIPIANPDAVSEEDIVRMRKGDELFEQWRTVLARVLERVDLSDSVDVEREVLEAARDEIREWKSQLNEKARKSAILSSLRDGIVKGAIGFATGLTIGKEANSVAVGALATSALWTIWGSLQGIKDRAKLRLAKQHFLAVGMTE